MDNIEVEPVEENITDDEDFLEFVNIVAPIRNARIYRERENQFDKWSDQEFVVRFRLPKDIVRIIVDLISNEISNVTIWNHAISAEEMVLLTLRFYATGSMMIVAGDFLGIHKSTACRVIRKVSRAIARRANMFINMPRNEEERRIKIAEFYNIASFPKCIGAIDCTHIRIQSPGGDQAEIYRNRKGYFSMNVQIVCDALLKVENIVCRWPGSCHDSTILDNSQLRRKFENNDFSDAVLVGDSGYPITPYLITPLAQPHTEAEHLFNESQIRTRNPIERFNGVWKRRFPIVGLGLQVTVPNIEAIVVATAVLHNIARSHNLPEIPVDPDIAGSINFVNNWNYPDNDIRGDRLLNNATRLAMIRNHFA